MFRALFRRLLMGNDNNPPSDPPPSLRDDAHNDPTPSAPQYCIDTGVVRHHIPQQPRSESNEIGVARDDFAGKLATVEPPISRRSWGALGPYSWEHKILLVGEGDFSFSTSLALAFGDASNMIATSLDSFEFLMENYARAVSNIVELTSKNSEVMHEVDATKMANYPRLRCLKFDRIVYNFPHAGFSNRGAPQEDQIRMHQKLVRGFLENAKKMLQDDGQIHITHKCVGFFLEWNIEGLGSCHGLRLVEESPFNLQDYPGYRTKFGYGGDANFDWKPAKTYKFELAKMKQVIGSYMYNADQSMLLVGEGDFSFAASLAVAFEDASSLVATSLDSLDTGVVRHHIPQQPRSESNEIGVARDDLAGQLATVEPPISRRSWGALGPYSWEHKILLVGEGDFSFSTSLALAFGDASNMIATSLDSFEFLMENYARAVSNIMELTSKNSEVMHEVDTTKMASYPRLRCLKFDRIVYNFPHAGFSNLDAPKKDQKREHRKLVKGFLGNAKKMLQDDGQIHITSHMCVGFHLGWNIEMLGSFQGLRLVEETPFDLRHYPGYNTKYGFGGDKNFEWKAAKTYKFELDKKKPVFPEREPVSEVIAKAIGGREPQGNLSELEQPKKLGSYIYNADQRMLLVGEGDFSFAASLAVAFGDASSLVATSLDSLEFLKENYKRAESNILALTSRGCKVMLGVNATTMANKHPELGSLKFSCIVFNFPLAVFSDGKPPRDAQLSKHQELVRAFLANAKQMVRADGQIHITHACFGWYLEWNVATLGTSAGLELVEESPFNSRAYRGYCSKLGCGGDGSFVCDPAVTYKFQLPNNNVPKKKKKKTRRQGTLWDVC